MIRQSFSWWCFVNHGVEPEALLAGAARIGYDGVDLIEEKYWPDAKRHGLRISTVDGHGSIVSGLNRAENGPRIEKELRHKIALARQWEIPVLICFAGSRDADINDAQGLEQSALTLKRIAPVAEEAGITLAVELLNSKVDHPGYQCDHTEWGVELCRRVDSPACKLLYDIYHLQIMEGDIIRTIQAHHQHFAYYHTAGNPGRIQPDENQEINYPAIYRAIAATGYDGFLSHEFTPKGNPLDALAEAFHQCRDAVK